MKAVCTTYKSHQHIFLSIIFIAQFFQNTIYFFISSSSNKLFTNLPPSSSKFSTSPATCNPNPKHTSNEKKGIKCCLIKELLCHLLTSSRITMFDMSNMSSTSSIHLNGVCCILWRWNEIRLLFVSTICSV